MIDVKKEEESPIRAYLVGLSESSSDTAACPSELHGLIKTLSMETAGYTILHKIQPAPKYGMGSGKAEEIMQCAAECAADCIIFDFTVLPTQQRNWEETAKIPCFDRQEVILRIFASRARTREAVLQVEMARLQYSLPRLAHMYGDMARQRGGSYGSKGSGETQLELDRRAVENKIANIKTELKHVVKERETQRKKRDKIPLPVCALVGYTNAGKSSLLNALTGSDVFVEDALFATLDPTTRRLSLAGGTGVLLTDTVGFIGNLPHGLVDAFKSTLEEAVRADLLLIVIDASDPDACTQYETVIRVLEEIGADKNERIVLLNKMDKTARAAHSSSVIPFPGPLDTLEARFPDALKVSAKEKTGFEELEKEICRRLFGSDIRLILPAEQSHLVQLIRKTGTILDEQWHDDGIHITARVRGSTLQKVSVYISEDLE